jgi:hypothetical protein
MPRGILSRRALLTAAGLGTAGVVGTRIGLPRVFRAGPVRPVSALSPAARALVALALEGLDPARVVDGHVHVVGLGGASSGCWANPRLLSHWHPLERLRFELYLEACGVREDESCDQAYVERLLELARGADPRIRRLLLAFDARVDEHGEEDREGSMFVVPDEWVLGLARAHPEFLACASVHPHRLDARERLVRAAEAGAVAVKWLPAAMGIDPAAERCRPYYRWLRELGLPLLVHTGEERAVWSSDQDLGNPLRLRAALEEGATVVALHCASLGEARDLDAGGRPAPAFELFVRLLEESLSGGAPGELHGEISAVVQLNRVPGIVRTLLEREDLHVRLHDGSDYPLVAFDPLVRLGKLVTEGVLDPDETAPLREVFEANPLLFDLVLKRRLRVLADGLERRFPAGVFESAALFGLA